MNFIFCNRFHHLADRTMLKLPFSTALFVVQLTASLSFLPATDLYPHFPWIFAKFALQVLLDDRQ